MNYKLFKYIITGILSFESLQDDDWFHSLYADYKEIIGPSEYYKQLADHDKVVQFCTDYFGDFTPHENCVWLKALYPDEPSVRQIQEDFENIL